ncbi:MAG: hypothetical protein CMK99_10215 [Pseudomonas sp.]|nr:hypothetical protein [Pseudomonas sp.]|tara:strand:+ start:46130 stop:46339 length:210 start_codon:yes stop_codon:yes gene_type:complete
MQNGQMTKARTLVAEKAFRWWAALEMPINQRQSEEAKDELVKAIQAAVDDGCWQAEVKNLKKGLRIPGL